MSTEFVVDVRTPNIPGLLAVTWERDVPDGFQMVSLVSDRPPRLIVTIERLDEPPAGETP